MTTQPYHWLQTIENYVAKVKEIPLWGSPPTIHWDMLADTLGKTLEIDNLKIQPLSSEWRSSEDVVEGLGAQGVQIAVELTPLSGTAHFVMANEDIDELISWTLSSSTRDKLSNAQLHDGYYHFLCLEALYGIDILALFGDLRPKMSSVDAIPDEGAYCIDIKISRNERSIWGRIICPDGFHNDFKSYFSQQKPALLSYELVKEVEVPLSVVAGVTTLKYQEFKDVTCGDVIVLDRSFYDPSTQKGSLTLALENVPLFSVRCKQDKIKILDYAFYYEDNNTMSEKLPGDENEEPAYGGENEPPSPENFDEDISEENEEPLWAPKGEESSMVSNTLEAHHIPVVLTVEVARVSMNLEKLLQLTPGNVLDLAVKPEQGVDLTVNGKRVAKGELVKIGETIGVKILRLGS